MTSTVCQDSPCTVCTVYDAQPGTKDCIIFEVTPNSTCLVEFVLPARGGWARGSAAPKVGSRDDAGGHRPRRPGSPVQQRVILLLRAGLLHGSCRHVVAAPDACNLEVEGGARVTDAEDASKVAVLCIPPLATARQAHEVQGSHESVARRRAAKPVSGHGLPRATSCCPAAACNSCNLYGTFRCVRILRSFITLPTAILNKNH